MITEVIIISKRVYIIDAYLDNAFQISDDATRMAMRRTIRQLKMAAVIDSMNEVI